MTVKEQVASDLKEAMRARDEVRVATLRLLLAAIRREEVDRTDPKHQRYGQPVGDPEAMGVIGREIKQRQESIEAYRAGKRQDLVDREEAEMRILQEYLPQQLTREQVRERVAALVTQLGPDFRKVMPVAARELRGAADGRMVNEVVKELTGG
jgi:uncharacterized protein